MRQSGLGVVIEYAGRTGPAAMDGAFGGGVWDTRCLAARARARGARRARSAGVQSRSGWATAGWITGSSTARSFRNTDPIRVKAGGRYRLIFDNQSDDAHPVHLHRHTFELVSIAGKPTAGVMKDVVMCPPRQKVEVQFVADNPGPTLFHCHQQLHMDFGFMAMVEYEGYHEASRR